MVIMKKYNDVILTFELFIDLSSSSKLKSMDEAVLFSERTLS